MARYPFAVSLEKKAVSTSVEEIGLPPVSPRGIRSFDVISGMDETSAPTTIEVGVRQGNTYIPIKRAAPGAANISVGIDTKIWISGEWRAFVRFYGATAADTLRASFMGYADDGIAE